MKDVLEINNIFSFKNFYIFDKKDKSDFIKIILDDKNKYFEKVSYDKAINSNVPLTINTHTNKLYDKFLTLSQKNFGPFNLLKNNSNKCWSLLTNKNNYASVPHDHIKTSVINSVYYLSVPEQKGSIQFYIDEKWIDYQPDENELLIFPSYLKHNTTKNNTEKWRISINMEIICDFDWSKFSI
tara:strand:- start:299 stop:847 length:549 start_codon:yes stop_codon:yes gene_type:complete